MAEFSIVRQIPRSPVKDKITKTGEANGSTTEVPWEQRSRFKLSVESGSVELIFMRETESGFEEIEEGERWPVQSPGEAEYAFANRPDYPDRIDIKATDNGTDYTFLVLRT